MEYFQVHQTSAVSPVDVAQAPSPDRYPLVTREGVVPVNQLSERGLYRQARYAGLYGSSPEPAPEPATNHPAADFADYEPVAPQAAPREADARPPLAHAEGSVTRVASNDSARVINVAAALASR